MRVSKGIVAVAALTAVAGTAIAGGTTKAAGKPKAAAAAKALPKGDAAKGKEQYSLYCVTCHGDGGKGDGPSAAGLAVKPRDHSDDAVMSKLTDNQVFKAIKDGGKAVGKSELMPAWGGALDDQQIADVLAHIRSLHQKK